MAGGLTDALSLAEALEKRLNEVEKPKAAPQGHEGKDAGRKNEEDSERAKNVRQFMEENYLVVAVTDPIQLDLSAQRSDLLGVVLGLLGISGGTLKGPSGTLGGVTGLLGLVLVSPALLRQLRGDHPRLAPGLPSFLFYFNLTCKMMFALELFTKMVNGADLERTIRFDFCCGKARLEQNTSSRERKGKHAERQKDKTRRRFATRTI